MSWLQLEQQLFILSLLSLLSPCLWGEESCRDQMWPWAQQTGCPAPGEVVVVGVEEPGARPAADSEHQADDEEEEAGEQVQDNIDQDEVVTKPVENSQIVNYAK